MGPTGGRVLAGPPDVARPSAARIAWLAVRPATLPASASGVVVGLGAAVATGARLRFDAALLCLAVAILLQVAANLANDLSDFRRGTDVPDRLGPTRVAASGLVPERTLEAAIALDLLAACGGGLGLAAIGGPVVILVGVAAVLATVAYTGGPWPYGYHALGEPFVFVFFGLVAVAGTCYFQTGRVEPLALAAAVPVGALITAILVVNNLRDIETDARAGKRTLAVLVGRRATEAELIALAVVAFAAPLLLVPSQGPLVALPSATLPLAARLARTIRSVDDGADPRRLNAVLKGTAQLTFVFSVAFAAGLAL